jgi:hypothetical protein
MGLHGLLRDSFTLPRAPTLQYAAIYRPVANPDPEVRYTEMQQHDLAALTDQYSLTFF